MEIKGLKINFLGDSITEGHGTSCPDKRFTNLLQNRCGIIANNYGIGGTRIARKQIPSACAIHDRDYCERVKTMDKTADAVVVFGGTNDFGHGDAPFGSFEDRTVNTFYGACHYLMSYLITEYTGKPIVICTPLHRADEEITNGRPTTRPLADYVKAIKEVASFYSLPVLDLWSESGMTPRVPAVKEALIPDGLHPNDAGHVILANKIEAFLRAL